MSFAQNITRLIPSSIRTRYRIHQKIRKENAELNSIGRIDCETGNLRREKDLSLDDLLCSREVENAWDEAKKEIDAFNIPDGTGGVNPGDRKALYYLISQLKPKSVLEVGTHIGASTLNIASALYASRIKKGENASLITVDILDVNSTATKPWLKYGVSRSPLEMIDSLNYGSFANFVSGSSIQYAETCKERFDFIFLDGDHSAKTDRPGNSSCFGTA